MFSKEISGLTLTNGIASTLFQNITGNKFRSDESFVATLRALLHSRVPKEESVTLQYSSTDYSAGQLSDSAPRDCVRAFIRDTNITYGENGILLIHSFEGRSEEDNTACFKVLDEGVPKAVKGFKPLDDLSNWIETTAKFRAKVYINEEKALHHRLHGEDEHQAVAHAGVSCDPVLPVVLRPESAERGRA